jgi:acyl carrier protein
MASVQPLSPLQARIREIVLEESEWAGNAEFLHAELDLIGAGILDSVGIFQVISRLQAEYGIEIRDGEIQLSYFESITAIARLVAGKRST